MEAIQILPLVVLKNWDFLIDSQLKQNGNMLQKLGSNTLYFLGMTQKLSDYLHGLTKMRMNPLKKVAPKPVHWGLYDIYGNCTELDLLIQLR